MPAQRNGLHQATHRAAPTGRRRRGGGDVRRLAGAVVLPLPGVAALRPPGRLLGQFRPDIGRGDPVLRVGRRHDRVAQQLGPDRVPAPRGAVGVADGQRGLQGVARLRRGARFRRRGVPAVRRAHRGVGGADARRPVPQRVRGPDGDGDRAAALGDVVRAPRAHAEHGDRRRRQLRDDGDHLRRRPAPRAGGRRRREHAARPLAVHARRDRRVRPPPARRARGAAAARRCSRRARRSGRSRSRTAC